MQFFPNLHLYTQLTVCFLAIHAPSLLANCNEADISEDALILINDILLVRNNIFDENAESFNRVQNIANRLHVTSLPKTILRDIPIKIGEHASKKQIYEAERILRKKPYYREAQIQTEFIDNCQSARLFINTWDNWSLQPRLSFGKSGGKSKTSIGIKDDNLLGLGIGAELRYFSQDTRDGYILGLQAPFHNPTHSNIALQWSQNSDGYDRELAISNPFYSYADNWYFELNYLDSLADKTIYRNNLLSNEFIQNSHAYNFNAGYQIFDNSRQTVRLLTGISDSHINNVSLTQTEFLPLNRDYTTPWLGLEFLQKDFSETNNISFVNRTEDVYLGWYGKASLGKNLASSSIVQDATILDLGISNTKLINQQHIFKNQLSIHNELLNNFDDVLAIDFDSSLFYRINNKWALFSRANLAQFNNPFGDQPLTLGENLDIGIRGYPLQYHHGDKRGILTFEARYYAKHSFFDLLDVGYASFVDLGKTWGGETSNLGSSKLASIGLGMRLVPNRSSSNKVIHIDLSHPLTTDTNSSLDSVNFSIRVKQGF